MKERGTSLLVPLTKLENLLGHKLGMTFETIELRVDEAINRQLIAHNFRVMKISYADVDWENLVDKAASKLPPFSSGQSEKGFKDALVLEGFDQLARSLPRSPKSCRIALLTNDGTLQSAARERTSDLQNVNTISDLSELKTMLTSIAAHIEQSDIDSIIERVRTLFFEINNQDTLYYKWNVRQKIKSDYGDPVWKPPGASFRISSDRFFISTPTFLAKESQRLTFSSVITVKMEAEKYEVQPSAQADRAVVNQGLFSNLISDSRNISALPSPSSQKWKLTPPDTLGVGIPHHSEMSIFDSQVKRITKSGIHRFEVQWSIILNRKGSLTAPSMIAITHESSEWDG